MTYLKLDFVNDIDYEFFLRAILMTINNGCNQYLRLYEWRQKISKYRPRDVKKAFLLKIFMV